MSYSTTPEGNMFTVPTFNAYAPYSINTEGGYKHPQVNVSIPATGVCQVWTYTNLSNLTFPA